MILLDAGRRAADHPSVGAGARPYAAVNAIVCVHQVGSWQWVRNSSMVFVVELPEVIRFGRSSVIVRTQ